MERSGPLAPVIREATPADAPGIARVHIETWRHAYRGIAFLAALSVEGRAASWRARLERPAPRAAVDVAEVDGRIVGFIAVGPSRDEDAREATGEVVAIYVAPSAMGQGIGSLLMRAGLSQLAAHGFAEATLWVLADNASGRAFYARRGWHFDGRERAEPIGGVTLRELRYRCALP